MPVRTACIHKAHSVALVHSRTLRRCVVSRFAATRPHNGLTHTGGCAACSVDLRSVRVCTSSDTGAGPWMKPAVQHLQARSLTG